MFVTEEIEPSDEDGEPIYQNQKVQFYFREKRIIEDHMVQIVGRVVSSFEKRYFNISNINPNINISNINSFQILSLANEQIFWRPTTLIIELCLCARFSNASLEKLFSKRIIKTTLRNRLTNDSLRINISGFLLQSVHDEHLEKCVNYCFNAKNRRNFYEKRESKKTKRPLFNISDILSALPIHLHQKMKL